MLYNHVPSRRASNGTQFSRRLLCGVSGGALLASAFAAPALAQSQSDSPTDDTIKLNTISVVGDTENPYKTDNSASQKFTAPLLDTPKSVTIIPKEIIEEQNATSLQDVLRTTPGITLGAGEGGIPNADLPKIRGFGAEGNIYVDGMRDNGAQTRDIFNLEQVEIVKGPGSAYSGAGAAGGSINLVTKKPQQENFARGSAAVGFPLAKRGTIDANYAISDKAAIRVNFLAEDSEVAGRDEVDISSIGFAPSMSLDFGHDTRATLSYYHLNTDDMPDYGHPYDPNTGKPVDVDRDNFYGLVNRDFQKTTMDSGTLELEHDINKSLTLRNVTRYSWSENDYIVTNPNDSAADNISEGTVWRAVKSRNADTETIGNQTDLSGDLNLWNMKHSYNAGVEVSYESTKNRGYTVDTGNRDCSATGTGAGSGYNCTSLFSPNPSDPWSGSITPASTGTRTFVSTKSVYVFDTVELSPQWLLNGGIRFDSYYTKSGDTDNKSEFVNYQAGIVYKPRENGSIYASYGTSSNPSGITAGNGTDNISTGNSNLDPEETVSYELGTKWDLLDNALSVTAAAFRTEKNNARYATAAGRNAPQELGGNQVVNGFELGLSGKVTKKWRVFGGYTFMHGRIVDDGPISSDEGNVIPNTPAHSASIWSTYDVTEQFSAGGGATYVSKRYGNTTNTYEVPDFLRLDATMAYTVNENCDLRFNVNNLLDTTYYDKPYSTHFATVAPGRSYLLTMNLSF